MAVDKNMVKEGKQFQSVRETLTYSVTTTPWGSGPTSPTVTVYDVTDSYANVTADVTTGSASATGDSIATPPIHSLEIGHTYRVDVAFTISPNTWLAWFEIVAVR